MTDQRKFATLCLTLLLAVALPLHAVKEVEMPADFGSGGWAMSNWNDAAGYLKYIAKDEVREELAALPVGERLDAWRELWTAFEPAMDSEHREQYFQRIRYANEHFGTILQPGWKTEMGETWIRLGQPDWRDRYTMRSGGRDLEVWNYMDSRDTYLVFVDRTGLGDYNLLNYSTMIDEVYFYN